jgi:hypothetical protein
MAVIALATFIVKTNNAHAIHDIHRTVLVPVLSRWNRLRHLPNHQLKYCAIRRNIFEASDELSRRVGYFANICICCKNANTNRKKIGNQKIRTRPQSNPESQI